MTPGSALGGDDGTDALDASSVPLSRGSDRGIGGRLSAFFGPICGAPNPTPPPAAASVSPAANKQSSKISATIHVTPLRASRPLALRWLAHHRNVALENFVVVTMGDPQQKLKGLLKSSGGDRQQHTRTASGDAVGGRCGHKVRPLLFASNDAEELIGGLPRTVVLCAAAIGHDHTAQQQASPLPADSRRGSAHQRAAVAFAVDVGAYKEDRVLVLSPPPKVVGG